jgi:chorismate mutase|tara:strand:- start:1675 stop:1866 length:192 start_codon:yes stop_codon:yes gene_type:complete
MKLKDQIAGWVVAKINDPETKEKVVSKWNENVNIPILNEATEEKIFSAIYDSVVDVFEDVLKK